MDVLPRLIQPIDNAHEHTKLNYTDNVNHHQLNRKFTLMKNIK